MEGDTTRVRETLSQGMVYSISGYLRRLAQSSVCWLLLVGSSWVTRVPGMLRVATVMPPPARLRRWAVASLAVAGTFHAFSGATTPAVSSALDVQVQVGTPFTYRITINQAWIINSFDAYPLPPGLTLNKKLGFIAGKPTVVGTNDVTLVASQDNLPDRTLTDSMTLRVTAAPAPPLFSLNPVDTIAVAGDDVILTSAAIGTGTIRFQWYRGESFRGNVFLGPIIVGATNAALVLPHVTVDDGGYYFSSAINAAGTNYSQPAQVSLILPPQIYSQPDNVTIHEGAPFGIYIYADGGVVLNYQWRKAGNSIPGATNDFWYVDAAVPGDAGSYDVVLDNAAGQLTSNPARVTVADPLRVQMIRTSPKSAVLKFNSIPGASYSINYADRLTNTWDNWNYLTDFTATGSNSVKNVLSTSPVRFFRVTPD